MRKYLCEEVKMDIEAKNKITRARSQLILYNPFWGYLATHLEAVETNNLSNKTLATDGMHLFYDAGYINSLGDDDKAMNILKGIVAHETFHCAFGHCWRGGDRNEQIWGVACDGVTNYHLKQQGFELPDIAVNIPSAGTMSVEDLYAKLMRDQEQKGDKYGEPLDDHSKWGKAPESNKGDSDKSNEQEQEGDGESQGKDKGKSKSQSKDRGKDGIKDNTGDKEIGPAEREKRNEDLRNAARSIFNNENKTKSLESKWKMNVNRASQMAKMQGIDPGSMEELIGDLLEPKLNWREILRNFIISSAKSNYRIIPPSKKHIHRGVYLPSCYGEKVEIGYAVDTSGSMDIDEIRDGLRELTGICQQFSDWHIHFFQCDAAIQEVSEFTPYSLEWPDKVKGRGGTDFRPVFDYIDKHAINISCLAYFTDGWGTPPTTRPNYPVLWIISKEGVKKEDRYWNEMHHIGEVITT